MLGIDYISISSSFHLDLRKKIMLENENSLSDMLISAHTGRQALGILGALNRRHGWNMGQPVAEELRHTITLEQIQQKYAIQSSSPTAALEQKEDGNNLSLTAAFNANTATTEPLQAPGIDDID
jgi:hypothetical protein